MAFHCQKHDWLGQHDLADPYRSEVVRLSTALESARNTQGLNIRRVADCKAEIQRARAENLEKMNKFQELASEKAVVVRDIRSFRKRISEAQREFGDYKDDETGYAIQQRIYASRVEQPNVKIDLLEKSIAELESQLKNSI